MADRELLRETVRRGCAFGWAFTRLKGKVPCDRGWQKAEPASLNTVLTWIDEGYNIGLRCGHWSGVVVVDNDSGVDLALPRTVTVITGSGKWHYYFRPPADVELKNWVGKLGTGIDVRCDGGQVVVPGSIHPKTGKQYVFAPGLSPEEVELAPFPVEILPKQGPTPRAPAASPGNNGHSAYVSKALDNECRDVQAAAEGERNDRLNTAAFNLGQLVGGGAVAEADVVAALLSAASCWIGHNCTEAEIRQTIRSGLESGKRRPRSVPERAAPRQPAAKEERPAEPSDRDSGYVMVPGRHVTDLGEYHEIGTSAFAENVIGKFPPGLLYRRAEMAGEVAGEPGKRRFRPIGVDIMRLLIDHSVKLGKWVEKRGSHEQVMFYVPCGRDHASIVAAQAPRDARLPEIHLMSSFPVFTHGWELARPGFHAGVFYDEPPELRGLEPETDPDTIIETLTDLFIDFPFKDQASRENYFGLLLTPIIRPALSANIPLHLIMSPLERTGKSKLAEQGIGGIILGTAAPAMQSPDSPEEMDKRITSSLMAGDCLLHLDNIREFLDSAALASLLTATTYRGRVLGSSRLVDLPNNLTIIGSGNNVRATGELVKRSVPICLQPKTDAPELRGDFVHADFFGHILENRVRALSCLVGAVSLWVKAGRKPGTTPMGGFDQWAAAVGGILRHLGCNAWMANARQWREAADPRRADLRALVEAWYQEHGLSHVTAGELLEIAKRLDIFGDILSGKSDKGVLISFGMRVLNRNVDAPVAGFILRRTMNSNPTMYRLENGEGGKS